MTIPQLLAHRSRTTPPLAIDLFCGLGGWTDGLLAEGWQVVGFDIEQHDYGDGARYPAQLVLQDVLTIHGRQFKDAALIVASPPCQEFSYMAMPWSKAKEKQRKIEASPAEQKRLTALFDACFRIQREACEAAGYHIPMVVENVRGAQKWVGRSRWNFGSFYLWGDVPALMPITMRVIKQKGSMTPGVQRWCREGIAGLEGGRKSQAAGQPMRRDDGLKLPGNNAPRRWDERQVQRLCDAGTKAGTAYRGQCSGWGVAQYTGSKSNARKAASAAIAKIPFVLASHIARVWKPKEVAA